MGDPSVASPSPSPDDRSATALALTRQLLDELRPGSLRAVTLESDFEHDLGLDSLSRVELAVRIERALGVRLSETALVESLTLRQLLAALPVEAGAPEVLPPAVVEWSSPAASPDTATTLVEVLDWHVEAHPERVQIVYLAENGEQSITYRQLQAEADRVAAGLQRAGLEARQTVAIMLPTGADYFYTYFGILRAGGVPVPIYPPARVSHIEEHVRRHAGILANAEVALLVTVPEAGAVARLLEIRVPGLRRVVTVADLVAGAATLRPVRVQGSDMAFIQYTSGSTGDPKGVVLTHANLLANIRGIGVTIAIDEQDVFVSWLPLYHDMGLICAWLTSLYFARPLVVMSPLAFLARPERWLQAITRYRGTISAAPNFAYELCVKRIDEAALASLDLSSWRIAANGAEPVQPETLRRFSARFSACGLAAGALIPVYGLAENTVGLLCPPLGRGPRIDRVRRKAFSAAGRAEPAASDEATALNFVSCGRPMVGHQVRIVDALGNEVGERCEGRLEFRGPSATAGYYRNPEQTRRLFDGDWLDSGDRAYLAEGEVYLTGRTKDIIIRGGRNIYPHEIEDAVGSVGGVRRGCVAVFGSLDPASGTERLIVLAETRETGEAARAALRDRLVEVTTAVIGEPPDEVVLAPPQSVLKTSSGKIRRAACRALYEAGTIGQGETALWWQMLRLGFGSLRPLLRNSAAAAGQRLFGAYAWAVFLALALPTWLLTVLAPNPTLAWRINRLFARQLLKLTATSMTVRGAEAISSRQHLMVANHASYLDGLVLMAALPTPFTFVAKRELLGQRLISRYLRALGVIFVERFDSKGSLDAAAEMEQAMAAGKSLLVFPEGTFHRAAGLGAFHLGAFAAALSVRVPMVPVAINGTRAILRSGQLWPRHAPLQIAIGLPVQPCESSADAFAATLALRDAARRHILAHCGEPDLAAN